MPSILDQAMRVLALPGSALLELSARPSVELFGPAVLPGMLRAEALPLPPSDARYPPDTAAAAAAAWAANLTHAKLGVPIEVVFGAWRAPPPPPLAPACAPRNATSAPAPGPADPADDAELPACAYAVLYGIGRHGMTMLHAHSYRTPHRGRQARGGGDWDCVEAARQSAPTAPQRSLLERLERHGALVAESAEQSGSVRAALLQRSGRVKVNWSGAQAGRASVEASVSAVRVWLRSGAWQGLRVWQRRGSSEVEW